MAKIKSKLPAKKTTQKPRTVQFSPSQISSFDSEADVTPIVEFLESFRELVDERAQRPSKLISIKIPEPLLAAFRFKAQQSGVPYQTMIKRLMIEWIKKS